MTRLVHAELLKLWTTRTARVLLALAAAGTAALTGLVLTFAGRPGQPALGDDAVAQLVLAPNGPLTLAALVLGILGMAGEFRHGTATPTFLVTPVRGRVVAAKLVAAVIVGLLWWQGGIEELVVSLLRRPGLERWLPDGAALALTAPGDGTLPMWAGGLVFAAYALALAFLGGRLVVGRDLS